MPGFGTTDEIQDQRAEIARLKAEVADLRRQLASSESARDAAIAAIGPTEREVADLKRQLAEARKDTLIAVLEEAEACLQISEHDDYICQVVHIRKRVEKHRAALDAARKESA